MIILILVLIVTGCHRNRYKVDIRESKQVISISRLEDDLFNKAPSEIIPGIDDLKDKYQEFLRLFGYVINIGDISLPEWGENLLLFSTDKMNVEVFQEVKKQFPDLSKLESELGEAWSHYAYYFPEALIPGVYSFVSGFNNSIVTGDSTLAIGLDRYLGKDCKYYPMLGIYNYQTRNMVEEKIPSDCMYAWAASTWVLDEESEGSNTLLASMMHEGKLAYFTRCMLPSEPDSLIFGFTGDQLKFCNNNEKQMWDYLIEYDLLFNTESFTIRKFTGEAPFTSYFTNESPGRAAVWIAFRIIEKYMENNRSSALSELMELTDYQQLLSVARYAPK